MALSTPASDTSLAPVIVPREAPRGSSLYRDAWRRLLRNKHQCVIYDRNVAAMRADQAKIADVLRHECLRNPDQTLKMRMREMMAAARST